MTYSLGRIHAPDARDTNYSVKALLLAAPAAPITKLYKYWWDNGWWGDQQDTPQCVAYAWTHWLEDGPIQQTSTPPPVIQPEVLYHAAQLVDEWPGTNYDGTSVRAGAKVLQTKGFIKNYHWATNVEEAVNALLALGPVVVGTNWYSGMFEPIHDVIYPTGQIAGGHAYVLNGVNLKRGLVRVKNSWGKSWAGDGRVWMEIETLEKLINEDGEVCLATEIKK